MPENASQPRDKTTRRGEVERGEEGADGPAPEMGSGTFFLFSSVVTGVQSSTPTPITMSTA